MFVHLREGEKDAMWVVGGYPKKPGQKIIF